ncbi:hypothetical protein ABID08_002039 [Rhizobium binae]|uniref:Lipoprotein n=1 Tax=Rhizobium binae TaxID=1138190 RepID=A0ABV2MGM1_9HYPH|nr:hypothetical protein [Rhizobium binae]MBX4992870.1 hypothetical protein [Rhizobium binae]NKL49416.1 hypothetical protein [Rhizobium leguminosarum bv. viciae]QSY84187.1 hypothetical protein J2J99_10560 [Rhizobium binae]
MKSNIFVVAAVAVCLSSCGFTVPVAVISSNGEVMRGTATAAVSGGSFTVAGKLKGKETKCAGTYNALDQSVTISMPVQCSDGRKGFVIATREANKVDGSGRVRLNDGTEADFVFGKAAAAF